MKRVLKAFAFAAAIVVALVSCKKEDQPKEVALTGIELNATTQTLQVGQEFQLTVTYKPENATSKPAATWASDAPAVATVDGGKVVAVAAGTAKITATVGTFTAECAITVASAEEEILPVEGNSEWSIIGALLGTNWDKDFVAAKDGDIYVVKNVKLAASDAFKFRKNKDWGENRGAEGDVEPYKLAAGTAITVIHNGKNLAAPGDGIYDIYYNAAVEQLCLVAKDGTPKWNEVPGPQEGLVMDGDASDWAELNPDYLVNLELPSDAEKTGIKSAKAYYDDKLYLLVELSDDALADSKARLHVYFDVDNSGLLKQNGWANSTIDYVTEGKVHENGAFVAYGSTLYATLQESWACTDTGFSPAYESAGAGNLYELSMDFEGAPAALPEAFNFGVDVVYSDWSCNGFLPVADKLARIVKVGATDPGEVVEYVHDYTPSAEYLADSNLWKAVDTAGPDIYFYHCSGGVDNWDGKDTHVSTIDEVPFAAFEQSTYTLTYEGATNAQWMNQFFLFPKAENAIPVAAGDKLKFKATVYSDQAHPHAFFKLVTYNSDKPDKPEGGVLWEFGYQPIAAGEPLVIENAEIVVADGVSADNVVLVFDFGGNPENNKIYIKDIILEKVVPETGSSVSEIIAAADETAIELKESLVVAKCVRGVIVTDGSKYIYAYGQNPLADVKVGDKVTMKGTKKTYNGVPEIDSPTDVVVKSSGNAVPAIEAKDITATVESYAATEAEYISLTGTLAKSGNYYNLNLEGTTAKVGSISYPSPELNADSFDGKKITVTGFFNGLSGGGKYVNIVTTKIEEVGAAPVSIAIDGDFSEWAGVPSAPESDSFKAFKVWNDADNFYFYVETDPGSRLWSGGAYLYLYFDFDNDLTTGAYSGSTGMGSNKYEAFVFMYLFGGTADAPEIMDNPNGGEAKGMTLDNIVIAGNNPATKSDLVIMEIKVPRANFTDQVTSGTVIGVNAYRSKDGGNVNFPGYVVK